MPILIRHFGPRPISTNPEPIRINSLPVLIRAAFYIDAKCRVVVKRWSLRSNTSEIEHTDTRFDINMNDITSNATFDVVPADRPDECRVATSNTAVTNSVTSNTVNMPMRKQFDMSKINGLLCGENINCGTINFNFNSSNSTGFQ